MERWTVGQLAERRKTGLAASLEETRRHFRPTRGERTTIVDDLFEDDTQERYTRYAAIVANRKMSRVHGE